MRNKTRNTPNRDSAIPAAAPAMLGKPRRAAARAMVRKKTDQDNIANLHSVICIASYYSCGTGRYQFRKYLWK
jgi:hypothetical protein